jgi:hypothetical protein
MSTGGRHGFETAVRVDGEATLSKRGGRTPGHAGREHPDPRLPVPGLRLAPRDQSSAERAYVSADVLGRRRVARTINQRRLRVLARAEADEAHGEHPRPRTRGECLDAPRPCPYVGCRHHLALDVTPSGSISEPYPGRELEALADTCSLDVADRGEHTLDEIGRILGVSRERVRQIESTAARRTRNTVPETLHRTVLEALESEPVHHGAPAGRPDPVSDWPRLTGGYSKPRGR